jgi:tRNA nucleotidyltransferase (CCA-adding enzyme)
VAAAILEGKEAADQALIQLFHLGEPSRSQTYHLLSSIGTEYLLYMMAKSRQETSKRTISLYFTHLKHLKPELRGRDLVAMGFEPGPQIKEILNILHEARLNEVVQSKLEELELIKRTYGTKTAN